MSIARFLPGRSLLAVVFLLPFVTGCTSENLDSEPAMVSVNLAELSVPEGGTASLELSLKAAPPEPIAVQVVLTGAAFEIDGATTFSLDASDVGQPYLIGVRAITDADEDDDTAVIEVQVEGQAPLIVRVTQTDTFPGDLQFDIPAAGAALSASLTLSVSGDASLVVRFLLDNVEEDVDEAPPYQWTLVPGDYPEGQHEITVVAERDGIEERVVVPVEFRAQPEGDLPYPRSTVILGLTFNESTRERLAPGSDNWTITWSDDGHQYAAWGDGGGFGGTNSNGRVSLGIARIEGDVDSYVGINVWGGYKKENSATFGGKSYGLLSVAGDIYMWVGPGSGTFSYTESRLHKSTDKAASWTSAGWAFFGSQNLILPCFLQFGKDYAGARDSFVYAYFPRKQFDKLNVHKPGMIDLARAPKDRIMEESAWEFFAGFSSGAPTWTSVPSDRKPVFEDSRGVGWVCSVSYNPGLGRYLLMTEHTSTGVGNIGIYDAPEPWGPWTTVYSEPQTGTRQFYWNFSNKWLSADGESFVMVYSGFSNDDAWRLIQGTFKTAK